MTETTAANEMTAVQGQAFVTALHGGRDSTLAYLSAMARYPIPPPIAPPVSGVMELKRVLLKVCAGLEAYADEVALATIDEQVATNEDAAASN